MARPAHAARTAGAAGALAVGRAEAGHEAADAAAAVAGHALTDGLAVGDDAVRRGVAVERHGAVGALARGGKGFGEAFPLALGFGRDGAGALAQLAVDPASHRLRAGEQPARWRRCVFLLVLIVRLFLWWPGLLGIGRWRRRRLPQSVPICVRARP